MIQIPILFSSLTGDENVYYYMGKIVSEGETPYVDFFYAHPPAQIYLYAGIIKLFGVHLWLLKGFTVLIVLGISYFLFKITKERYDEKIALVSVFLFLTSYDILIFGSFAFGIEIAVLFFMISWWYLNKKPYLSGVFIGLAIMTRLHVLSLALILWLYSKEKRKFLLGSGICLVYYGFLLRVPNFVDNVFMFHVNKMRLSGGWFSFLRANLPLFVLISYSFKKIKDTFTFELTLSYCAFLLIVGSVFEYHFLPITIILCIESAYALTYSRFRKWLWVMVLLWVLIMGFKVGFFVYDTSIEYNSFINEVSDYEGTIMGEPALTSLIALKTRKNVTRDMIDLNFQRRKIFDYKNSLVVYNERIFTGFLFNCSLLHSKTINDDVYKLWRC